MPQFFLISPSDAPSIARAYFRLAFLLSTQRTTPFSRHSFMNATVC
jgi:hypothetical protein